MRSRHLSSTSLMALLVAAAPLMAQGVSAQLGGRVLDPNGAAVAGATVVIRNGETGLTRTLQTNGEGRYLATLLPVGPYTVTVTKAGFQTAGNVKVNLNLGDAAPLTIRLAPETGAVVEIVAVAAAVDSERSAAATYVSPESLSNLPTNGRRWENFALLTPQVTISSRGDIAIGGQRGVNTAVNVDGGNYNSSFFGGTLGSGAEGTPFTISSEAIREFQVVTDGASAEFGGNGGGYLNAITKSGSNDFSGGLFYYERPQSLVATRHSNGRPVSDFTNRQFGASVGGPILKDKLFYFVSVDLQRDSRPNTVAFGPSASSPLTLNPAIPADAALIANSAPYTVKSNQDAFFARLDWIINTDHSLQFRANRSSFSGDYSTGYNVAYNSTSLEEGKTLSLTGQWNWTINANWINEFRINSVKEELPRTRRSDTPQVSITNVGRYGEGLFNREFESKQFQLSNIVTYATPQLQVRGGLQYISYDIFETFIPRSGGVYSFNNFADFQAGNWNRYEQFFSLQPGVSVEQAGTMDEKEKEFGAFLQADWRPSQTWKVGLGLRFDRQEHAGFGIADFTANPTTYTRPGPLTSKVPTDSSISPRLSFTWSPEADRGRTVVRGSAGLYVSRTPSVFMYQVLTSNGSRAALIRFTSVTPALATAYPAFTRGATFNYTNPFQFPGYDAANFPAAAAPDIQTFDPDFKNPRTTRFNLGADRSFLPGLTLGISATHAVTKNLERITDLNLPTAVPNVVGRPVYGARPNTSYRTMQVYKSDSEGRYTAFTVSAKYAPEGSWIDGQLFYTNARERDNDSNERSFSGYTTQDPNRLEDDFSWSANDRRHVVTGYVNIHEKWFTGMRFGFNFRYLSGQPYNPTFTSDRNGDGNNNDRVWGTERNSYREPGRYIVDLKIARDWKIAKRYAIGVSAEVFNLFNKTTRYTRTTGFAGNDTAYTTNVALSTLSTERQVQLGARFSF